MKYLNSSKIIIALFFLITTNSCVNPFAPNLDNGIAAETSLISDLSSIDGVFQNLQYSYTFRDTTIYGELLSKDFIFTFRDYDKEVDIAWGRTDEMHVTYGLFNNSERLDLIWNKIVAISKDSTNVVRSFNLTVTFNPTDIRYVDGKVNLQLSKNLKNKWQIVTWIDESNF